GREKTKMKDTEPYRDLEGSGTNEVGALRYQKRKVMVVGAGCLNKCTMTG
nr:hypothetical protein [Tanacetum cinerariifolium]